MKSASETPTTIFTTPAGREKMLVWHERFRARLRRPTQSQMLSTRYGCTHALACGSEEAPPLVLLHGAMASSAHALLEVETLADHFRVIALDIIGQSPMSAQVRPDVNGPAYGEWLLDCLDALHLPAARLLGVSWGGFVALRAAACAPKQISRLSLVVPAGLAQGGGWEGLRKFALPLMLYRAKPTPARLQNLLQHLFTTQDADWTAYMGDALQAYKFNFRAPRLLRDGELAALTAPVQVFGAEQDVSFPGRALIARARVVFPNLTADTLLPDTKHAPSFAPEARLQLAAAIAAFMQED